MLPSCLVGNGQHIGSPGQCSETVREIVCLTRSARLVSGGGERGLGRQAPEHMLLPLCLSRGGPGSCEIHHRGDRAGK